MSDIRLDTDGSGHLAARRARLLRAGGLVALGMVLVVATLPRLASTGPGKRVFLSLLDQRIAGGASVGSVSIGWRSGLRVRGLELLDPGGAVVLRGLNLDAEDATPGRLLLAWALGDASGFDVKVRAAEADLVRDAGGRLNLLRALDPRARGGGDRDADSMPAAAEASEIHGVPAPPASRLTLAIERLRWRAAEAATPLIATGVEAELDGRDPDRIRLALAADTRRAGLAGRIDAEAEVLRAATHDGRLALREAGVDVSGRLERFPVAVLDEWFAGADAGAVERLAGASLDAFVHATGSLGAPRLVFEASTPRIDAGLELVRVGSGVEAAPGGGLSWRLTPAGFESIAPGRGWAMTRDAVLRLEVERLRIPEAAAGAQPEWAALSVGGVLEDFSLESAEGFVALEDGRVRLTSEAPGQRVDVAVAAGVRRPSGAGSLRASLSLLNARTVAEAGRPRLELDAAGLPTEFLSLLGPRGAWLAGFLGPELGVRLQAVQQAPSGPLRARPTGVAAEVRVASAGVRGPLLVTLGGGGSEGAVSSPEPLRLLLRDEALGDAGLLGGLAEVRLDEPLAASLDLREIRWRWLPGEGDAVPAPPTRDGTAAPLGWLTRLDPAGTGLAATLRVDAARLRGRRGGVVAVEDLGVEVAAERLGNEPEVMARLRVVPTAADDPVTEQGTLRAGLRVAGLVDDHGRIRPAGATLTGKLLGDGLPTEALDRFLAGDGRLPAIVGPAFAPSLSAVIEPGVPPRLDAGFQSAQAVVGIGGTVHDEELKLGPDASLQLALTKAGADAIRGRLHPLTRDLVRGVPGHPLRLTPRAGARVRPGAGWAGWLPLFEEAGLDGGRLELRRGGWLTEALDAVVRQRLPEWQASVTPRFEVDASPTTLRLEGGRLHHGPLWLTSPAWVLGLAGWADVAPKPAAAGTDAEEASRIGMTLALPGASLRATGLPPRVVAPTAVYTFPLGGWISNPRPATDRFATDLLLAESSGDLAEWEAEPGAWSMPPEVRVAMDGLGVRPGGRVAGDRPTGSPRP